MAVFGFIAAAGLLLVLFFRADQPVIVQNYPDLLETVYRVEDRNGQVISFTVYGTEANRGVLRFRSASTRTLNEQLVIASKILARIDRDRELRNFESLSIGRLVNAFGSDDTLSRRLIATARSGEALPVANLNGTVLELANKNYIYPELQAMFTKYDLSIKMSGVEKVLTNDQHLPYDCLTWFSIKPSQKEATN